MHAAGTAAIAVDRLERALVDAEATARVERAEPGDDEPYAQRQAQPRTALEVHDGAIGDDVAGIGQKLAARRRRDPRRREAVERNAERVPAGHRAHQHDAAGRQPERGNHQR
jgi:hypothetical protein